MFWGTMLEPIVAAHYTKRTGNKVRRVNAVLQHPEHPWMLANVDREVVGIRGADSGMQNCRHPWRTPVADGVPEYVQLQVMHQLAVTGHRLLMWPCSLGVRSCASSGLSETRH
jgi:putative phage-type endonuclease